MIELTLNEYQTEFIGGHEYIVLCESKAIPDGRSVRVEFPDFADYELAVFRVAGKLYCVSNICPHEHTNHIYKGIIVGKMVVCPMHGWAFSLESGKNTDENLGLKSLKKYEILEIDNRILVEKPEFETPKWMQML